MYISLLNVINNIGDYIYINNVDSEFDISFLIRNISDKTGVIYKPSIKKQLAIKFKTIDAGYYTLSYIFNKLNLDAETKSAILELCLTMELTNLSLAAQIIKGLLIEKTINI